jgi:NOL1/NOP2/sun family putative RNA methylase
VTIDKKIETFKLQLKEIFNSDYDKIISNLSIKTPKVFRVVDYNNSKNVIGQLKEEGIECEVSEYEDCFYIKDFNQSDKLSKTKSFLNSEIYIQEIASSLPVRVLDPKPTEKILDMCAAPGSKTIQIYNYLQNQSGENIYALEKDPKRFFELKNNLKKYGVENVNLFKTDARDLHKLDSKFNNYFDKILLDAPCSNENKLNFADPKYFQFWSHKKSKLISKLQKGLIQSAFNLLKTGGILIYSTCTYSVYENELVIDYLLRKNSDAKVVDINVLDNIPSENKADGLIEWKDKNLDSSIKKSLRVIPGGLYRGFYVAKITKT